jgi:hypothetical protein
MPMTASEISEVPRQRRNDRRPSPFQIDSSSSERQDPHHQVPEQAGGHPGRRDHRPEHGAEDRGAVPADGPPRRPGRPWPPTRLLAPDLSSRTPGADQEELRNMVQAPGQIPMAHRPPGYTGYATFQPAFLYELIWNLALAGALVWLGRHRAIQAPGLLALCVAGYSAFRIVEELLRVDSSEHFLGLRLNLFVACTVTLAGAACHRHPAPRPVPGRGPRHRAGSRRPGRGRR